MVSNKNLSPGTNPSCKFTVVDGSDRVQNPNSQTLPSHPATEQVSPTEYVCVRPSTCGAGIRLPSLTSKVAPATIWALGLPMVPISALADMPMLITTGTAIAGTDGLVCSTAM